MSETAHETWTGGCQCGAVRFRVDGPLGEASICHCRMCQKAFGHFYAPLVSVDAGDVTWTRAQPKRFQSSNHATRGFCPDCGTPLTYEAPDGLALAIGAFDRPVEIMPTVQFGIEAKLPFVDGIPALSQKRTEDDIDAAPFLDTVTSYQHPDRDTETWTPHADGTTGRKD